MFRSIFIKITAIFILLAVILLFLSIGTIQNSEDMLAEMRVKRYMQIARDIEKELNYNDLASLSEDLQENDLVLVCFGKDCNITSSEYIFLTKLYHKKRTIDVYTDSQNSLFLHMQINGINVILKDTQIPPFFRQNGLKILFFSVMVAFLGLYMMIMRLFLPVRLLQKDMERFGNGNLGVRSNIVGEDEIAVLAREFNYAADTVQNLIAQKDQLVLDISHEIRTPITKGKLSLELLPDSKYKDHLKKAFGQIDELTDTLLNSNGICKEGLHRETLILSQVLKVAIDNVLLSDSEAANSEIYDDLTIYADKTLITLVIKNLIDNAIKYAINNKAFIRLEKGVLYISNDADKLSKDLSYYLQPFTKEDNSRGTKGYGLGLNIVDRILKAHELELLYRYADGTNTFYINFYGISADNS